MPTPLNGTFRLTAGSCAGPVAGSYFRMLQPGRALNGPPAGYISNTNSPCRDKTYTPLAPGTDSGLITGVYQPEPSPAFDKTGNALANRIVKAAVFFGVRFSVSTEARDPQSGLSVPAPSVVADGARLTGDLRAVGASWNAGHFNQGSPKPNGSVPGLTRGPIGSYDAAAQVFALDWTSLIVGGPFDGFTGQWHFTGRFAPSENQPAHATTPTTGSSSSGVPAADSSTAGVPAVLATTGGGIELLVAIGAFLIVIGAAAMSARSPRLVRR